MKSYKKAVKKATGGILKGAKKALGVGKKKKVGKKSYRGKG